MDGVLEAKMEEIRGRVEMKVVSFGDELNVFGTRVWGTDAQN